MPLYTLMIRDDNVDPAQVPPEYAATHFQRFVDWAADLERRGKLRGVERLLPEGARTVRKRDGRIVVDGPFTEGKEAVLGFFIVEAADDEEAWRIAGEAPCIAIGGSLEVRLVGDFPKPR